MCVLTLAGTPSLTSMITRSESRLVCVYEKGFCVFVWVSMHGHAPVHKRPVHMADFLCFQITWTKVASIS